MKSHVWALWKERGSGHYQSFRRQLFPAMYQAHKAVSLAVARGDLRPAHEFRCTDCPKQAEHYDHRDYRDQLRVEPVCRGCNRRRGHALPYLDRSRATLLARLDGQ